MTSSQLLFYPINLCPPILDTARPNLAELLCSDPEKMRLNRFFQKNYGELDECRCDQFNRFSNPEFRRALEDSIIAALEKKHPDKTAKISLVSLGSGGCFQELVILSKLLKAGYSQICFTSIDTKYKESDSKQIFHLMHSFTENEFRHSYPRAAILLNFETDYTQHMEKIERGEIISPDAFLFIDIHTTFIDKLPLLDWGLNLFDQIDNVPSDTIVGYTRTCTRENIHEATNCLDICLTKLEYQTNKTSLKSLIEHIPPFPKRIERPLSTRELALLQGTGNASKLIIPANIANLLKFKIQDFVCYLITCKDSQLQSKPV